MFQLPKVISSSEYVLYFYHMCEWLLNHVLEQEAVSGSQSHGICVYDLEGASFAHFANPMSPVHKLLNSRVPFTRIFPSKTCIYQSHVPGVIMAGLLWRADRQSHSRQSAFISAVDMANSKANCSYQNAGNTDKSCRLGALSET